MSRKEFFSIRLRAHISRLDMSQSKVAELLGISQNTLECWLASEDKAWSRTPHKLMQVGALRVLNKAAGNRNLGPFKQKILHGGPKRFLITTPDGKQEEIVNLKKWARENGLLNGYTALSNRKIGKYQGYTAVCIDNERV